MSDEEKKSYKFSDRIMRFLFAVANNTITTTATTESMFQIYGTNKERQAKQEIAIKCVLCSCECALDKNCTFCFDDRRCNGQLSKLEFVACNFSFI